MAASPQCIHVQPPAQCPTCRKAARTQHRKAVATWMHLHPELSTTRHQKDQDSETFPLFRRTP